MRNIIFILLALLANPSIADNTFCRDNYDNSDVYSEFPVKFCFSSPEFMKDFALKLYDEGISFVVYKNGYIGYKHKDKERVQIIGDALVMEYLGNK